MQRRRAAASAALYERASAVTARSASSISSHTSISRRRSASEVLVETAAAVRHLGKLPTAFHAAHFLASQRGDIYFRLVKERLPPPTGDPRALSNGQNCILTGLERVRVQFALVVSVPPSSATPSPTSTCSGSLTTSMSTTPSLNKSEESDSVIAIRIQSLEVKRWGPQAPSDPNQFREQVEWEAEVIPDPEDNLEVVMERLERGAVRPEEVLWWRGSAGKWTLWNGRCLRSWCIGLWTERKD